MHIHQEESRQSKLGIKRQYFIFFLIFSLLGSQFFSTFAFNVYASSPWTQADWSGGSGQTNWSNATKFDSSSNVKTSVSGEITLDSTANWYNNSWKYRRKITFNNSAQAENLTNFPVMVKLDSTRISYTNTQDAGQDIRFTDFDGTTELKYEIEKWDEAGNSFVWVKVSQIDASSSTDYIYMYYGNSSATDAQDKNNVWSNNTLGRWHLNDTTLNDGSPIIDSSANSEDLQIVSGATSTTGKADGALIFSSPKQLKQKTYDSNQSLVSVTSSTLVDTGQDFSQWETTTGRFKYKVVTKRTDAKLKTQSQNSPTGTITGASSGATATVDYASSSLGYIEVSNVTGSFWPGETVNGTTGNAVLRYGYMYVPNTVTPNAGDSITGVSSGATGIVISKSASGSEWKVYYRRTSAVKFTRSEQVTFPGPTTVTSRETIHQDNPLMDLLTAGYIGDVTTNNTSPIFTLPSEGVSGWTTAFSWDKGTYANDDYPRGSSNPSITYEIYKADFDRQSNLTFNIWAVNKSGASIISKARDDEHANIGGGYGIGILSNTLLRIANLSNQVSSTISISASSWNLITLVYSNNNSVSIYLNGSLLSTSSYSVSNYSDTAILRSNYTCYYGEDYCSIENGTYDEFEITTDTWSAGWIAAKYKSESDTLNTYGPEEERYVSSGTLTSSIYDTEQSNNWGILTYNTDGVATTTVKVRTSNSSSMSGATDFSSCSAITSGTDISTNNCVTDGQRYVQYQIALASVSVDTPTFQNLSITFSQANISVTLDSPGNESYTNSERPIFKWKVGNEAGGLISNYSIEIDNGDSGDFTIDEIPASRTTDYETNKYVSHYEGFSDGDSNNNYISVYTKSVSDWRSDNNDGKLKEGKRSWKLKARDATGVEYVSSRTLFVDRTSPNIEINQVNEEKYATDSFSTTDKTPTIFGKITDLLAGDLSASSGQASINKVASGPKSVEIKIEKKNGLGFYEMQILATVNLNETYWISDGSKITDNSQNKSDKHSTFEFTPSTPLPFGNYKVLITGKDNKDNSGSTSAFYLNIVTYEQITTAKEKEIIDEELKPLRLEDQQRVKQQLEVTKPQEPSSLQNISNQIDNTSTIILSLFQGIYNSKVTPVVTAIGNVIGQGLKLTLDTTSNISNSTEQTLTVIYKGIQTIVSGTNQGITTTQGMIGWQIGNIGAAIGQEYTNLATKTPQVTKNILTGIGQGVSATVSTITTTVSTVETTKDELVQNTESLIVNSTHNTAKATKEGMANLAFNIGEKTDGVSNNVSVAIVKFGYLFATEPTKIYDVKVAVLTPTSAKISWITNHPATGKVNYGLDRSYSFDMQSDKRVTHHEFTLTNLKPNTQYHFEVMSQNKNYVYDANREFKTPKK